VLALNPHASDDGLIGKEENEIIKPAIDEAVADKIQCFGPFPADGFFAAGTYRKFDAVLAMYHDQGMIPFKLLGKDGVNFTAGLPIVRTSPAHGTAYDIAGKNIADAQSMRNAIYLALDILKNRKNLATHE
jgi:4-hydroxythreonine-4-phosphate dehydrogenase